MRRTSSLLIVLQAMDTGGKDGTINMSLQGVNPQAAASGHSKKPSDEEASHDFLWRYHQRTTPQRGMITIFNRSHYEDVMIVRVRQLVTENVMERYHAINEFEQMPSNITVIVFLHISKDEQNGGWRVGCRTQISAGSSDDLKERLLWDDTKSL